MQNFKVKDIAAKSVLAWGASPKTVQSFIDLQDLADIARLVILDPAPHNYARYDVVGDRRSLEDIASIITRRANLSAAVVCQQLPREQVAAMATKGQGAYAQEAMNMLLYYWDKRCDSPFLFCETFLMGLRFEEASLEITIPFAGYWDGNQ